MDCIESDAACSTSGHTGMGFKPARSTHCGTTLCGFIRGLESWHKVVTAKNSASQLTSLGQARTTHVLLLRAVHLRRPTPTKHAHRALAHRAKQTRNAHASVVSQCTCASGVAMSSMNCGWDDHFILGTICDCTRTPKRAHAQNRETRRTHTV